LLRFFRRKAGREDASDLLHDLFLRIARLDPRRLAEVERPEAYLHQVARNLLRDRAKTNARHVQDRHLPAEDIALAALPLEPLLEARDMLARLDAAMLGLKPRTREIFMARRLDGLSYVEIAAQTGLSIKAIEKQMARAIAHVDRVIGAR